MVESKKDYVIAPWGACLLSGNLDGAFIQVIASPNTTLWQVRVQ
jgi:hypothetical protein